jgi:hypothetical protein
MGGGAATAGGLSRPGGDPHPLTPSPTRTHTLPGEGEPPPKANKPAIAGMGGGAPLPGGRECGWERGWG